MSNYLNIKRSKKFQDTWTCIDLFCGAGGLSIGFAQAGGIPVAAIDNDFDSINTYKSIFPFVKDVHCMDIEEWMPANESLNAKVVVGGPPCQGFSLARGMRFMDDPRNRLYKEFVRIVKLVQPEWIVMENVNGITSIGKGQILTQIYEDFESIGYKLDHRLIDMALWGVPQKRKRVIFVANRYRKEFIWPVASHGKDDLKKPLVSIKEALCDLPWPLGNFFAHRANSQMRGPRNRDIICEQAFTLRTRGDEFAFCEHPATGAFIPGPIVPVEFVYVSEPQNEYQMAMRETCPPWLNLESRTPIKKTKVKPLQNTRRITLREQARLQSFPDWFTPVGSPYSQFRQIGNAVPPYFAKQLFEAIIAQNAALVKQPSRQLTCKMT